MNVIKKVIIPLLFGLIVLIIFLIRPFISGPEAVEKFCNTLETAVGIEQLKTDADKAELKLEFQTDQILIAHYPGAMGRFQCLITLENGKTVSANYRQN